MRTLTLAITHHNRLPLLLESFKQVIKDPRITEIVISDDCSTDGSYAELCAMFFKHEKVRLFRNDKNLDCYASKQKAVDRSTNPWVILFDSDNVITPDYMDALYAIPEWDEETIYTPEFAKPSFDFREFAGVIVHQSNVAELMMRPHFSTMLNAANYLVPRDLYCETWNPNVNPHTSDSIYMASLWLACGYQLQVVKNLQYFHRIHSGSHYKTNHHKTGDFARVVEQRLKQMR